MKAIREYQQIHTRLPFGLYERLVAYAERTHRSITNSVIHLLTAALDREEVDSRG